MYFSFTFFFRFPYLFMWISKTYFTTCLCMRVSVQLIWFASHKSRTVLNCFFFFFSSLFSASVQSLMNSFMASEFRSKKKIQSTRESSTFTVQLWFVGLFCGCMLSHSHWWPYENLQWTKWRKKKKQIMMHIHEIIKPQRSNWMHTDQWPS